MVYRTLTALVLLLVCLSAHAFTATITPGTRSAYLRVGDGSATGAFTQGGTMQNNSTINKVSVSVPATQVGNGVALVMESNATTGISHYDNFQFCNLPNHVYIAAFYRRQTTGATSGAVQVSTPANMVNADGATIPITQISWTTSGNQDTGAQPFPAGTFSGGSQALISPFTSNVWRESCYTFRYANSALRAAGTYTARATYTLVIP